MARVVYNLEPFDGNKAATGVLCVMVKSDTNGTVTNINEDGSTNSDFVGAGICKRINANTFNLVLDSNVYQFDVNGKGIKPWAIRDCKLMLATADVNITSSGNAAKSRGTTVVTRGTDGSTTTKTDYSKESDIIIDSLNARDEFAINALRELLNHVPDPSSLSNTEMSFYCNAAYKWAANMMEASANARGSFTQQSDNTGIDTSTTTRADVSESSLSSNTEKLLNNIVSALERTDYAEKVNDKTIYYDRVKVQFTELISFLNTYVKNGENVVGLKDLISSINAIKDSNASILGKIVDVNNNQTSAIQTLKTATETQEKSIKSLSDEVSTLKSGSLSTADIDTRIKSWLSKVTVVADGESGYKLNIPDSI